MNIYVGNLSLEINEDELRQEFVAFGQVKSVCIMNDKDISSGQSRGYGFVEMPDEAEARAAIAGLNGRELRGRRLIVNETRSRSAGYGGSKRPDEGYPGGGRRLW